VQHAETLSTREPTTSPTPERRRGRWRRRLELALVVAPVATFGWLGWHFRSLADDGYIYLHVVQQILAGNGPVFNAGQRVEVFTGPIWTFLLVPSTVLSPFSIETTAIVLGDLLAMAGLLLAAEAARRFWRERSPDAFLAPVGLLVPVAIYAYWWLSTSGLEDGLSMAWIGGCALVLSASATRGRTSLRRSELVLLGLGPLVRPEFLIFSGAAIAWYLVVQHRSLGWRRALPALAWFAALPVLYQLFRMGYYGELVANTAIAKEATRILPARGWGYFLNFFDVYWLWVPLLSLAVGGLVPTVRMLRRSTATPWAYGPIVVLPAAGLMSMAYVTLVGGDYISGRLLLPGFFAVVAPFALLPVRRSHAVAFVTVAWALFVGTMVRPLFGMASVPYATLPPVQDNHVTADTWKVAGLHLHGPGSRLYVTPPFFPNSVELDVRPERSLRVPATITNGIGAISVAFGDTLNIFDVYGLANPVGGHLRIEQGPSPSGFHGLPGHEKLLPIPWLIAMTSAPGTPVEAYSQAIRGVYVVPSEGYSSGDPFATAQSRRALTVQVAWARATLSCPPVQRFLASYRAPLSLSRFAENVVDSFSNTSLRFDQNPEIAYHQSCGGGVPPAVRSAIATP